MRLRCYITGLSGLVPCIQVAGNPTSENRLIQRLFSDSAQVSVHCWISCFLGQYGDKGMDAMVSEGEDRSYRGRSRSGALG